MFMPFTQEWIMAMIMLYFKLSNIINPNQFPVKFV